MAANTRFIKRIRGLAEDPLPAMRAVAQNLIWQTEGCDIETLYVLLDSKNPDLRRASLERLVADHFLRPLSARRTGIDEKEYDVFRFLADRERAFMGALRTLVEKAPPSKRQLSALASVSQIRDFVGLHLYGESRSFFDSECTARKEHEASALRNKRQLTLCTTFRCNLACPYCVNWGLDATHISVPDWHRFLAWARAQDVKTIVFTGGEPTLHPEFPRFLEELAADGFKSYFATNALFSDAVLERLHPDLVTELAIHLRDPYDDHLPAGYLDRMESTFRVLVERGIPLAVRYNIYRLEQDFEWLFDFLDRFEITNLRFALAVRGKQEGGQHVEVQRTGEFLPLLRRFIARARNASIEPIIAKPIPVCLFGEEDGLKLVTDGTLIPFCSVSIDGCTHNATINPDLTISPCFGVEPDSSQLGVRIDEVESWEKLQDMLTTVVNPLVHHPVLAYCERCYLFHRDLCQGFCLANKDAPSAG